MQKSILSASGEVEIVCPQDLDGRAQYLIDQIPALIERQRELNTK